MFDMVRKGRAFRLLIAATVAFVACCGWGWERDGIGMERVDDIDWWYTYPDGVNAVVENVTGYQAYSSAVDPETTEGDVVVPRFLGGRQVVAIGTNTFLNCEKVTSVVLPEGLRTICGESFVGCTALESIEFPTTLERIVSAAFSDCPSLLDMTIAVSGDLTVEDHALTDCPSLQTVTMAVDWDLTVGELAFTEVEALTDMVLSSQNMTLEVGAIAGCTELLDFWAAATNKMDVGTHCFSHGDADVSCVCDQLTNITLRATDVIVSDEICWSENSPFTFPCESLERLGITARTCSIGVQACYECDALENDDFAVEVLFVSPRAFCDCTALSHVGLAVTTNLVLRKECFFNTESLESIDLPDELREIGAAAFGESGLLSISIPASVTNVAESAFESCASLASLEFRAETARDVPLARRVTVGESAFADCGTLGTAVFSDRVVSFADECFLNCESLVEAELPISLETIGNSTFKNCRSLPDLDLPEHVESVGNLAYSGCTALKSVVARWGLRTLGDSCFSDCDALETVVFRERGAERSKVRQLTIGTAAFAELDSLATVSFSSNVWKIGVNAFNSCPVLEDVRLREGTHTICEHAFYRCFSVDCVELPASLAVLDRFAFALAGLDVDFARATVATGKGPGLAVGVGAFYGCETLKKLTLATTVTNIGVSAFADCFSLASVKFVKGLRQIGISAFSACHALKKVKLPSGLVDIGETAFKDCLVLETISIPSSVTHIGYWAFHNTAYAHSFMEGIVFYPAGERTIALETTEDFGAASVNLKGCRLLADGLFKGQSTLTKVSIPSTVTVIPNACFEGTSVKTVTIPSNVTRIGEGAFKSCSRLKTCTFPETVTDGLYENTFEGCGKLTGFAVVNPDVPLKRAGDLSLTKVYIAADAVTVASNAFAACSNLFEVVIPASVKSIAEGAFADCTKLAHVTFQHDHTLESLGDGCFSGCHSLKGIQLPYSLQTVGDRAFAECSALSGKFVMPEHVEEVGASVFTNCAQLTRVYFHGGEPAADPDFYAGTSYNRLCGAQIARMWFGKTDPEAFEWNSRPLLQVVDPPAVYRVTWDANGGEGTQTKYVIGNHAMLSFLPEGPTPPPKTEADGENDITRSFAGWYTKPTGGDRVTGETAVSAKTTFYAQYVESVTPGAPQGGFPWSEAYPYETVDEDPVATKKQSVWCGVAEDGETLLSVTISKRSVAYGVTNNVVTATVLKSGTSQTYVGVMKNGLPVLLRTDSCPDSALWLRFTTHGMTGDLDGSAVQGEKAHLPTTLSTGVYSRVGLPFSGKALVVNGDGMSWTYSASGLPKGLTIDAASGVISGVPEKSGTYDLTVTAKGGGTTCSAGYVLSVSGLHKKARGTFAGCVRDVDADGNDCEGPVSMTVSSAGRISGTVRLAGDDWTFSAKSYSAYSTADGSPVYSLSVKASRATDGTRRKLTLEVSAADGVVVGHFASPEGAGEVELSRLDWGTDGAADLAGYYTVVLDDKAEEAGYGYLGITVGRNGLVTYAGRLADATAVSGSAALVGDELGAYALIYAAPSGYAGGYVSVRVNLTPGESLLGGGVWASKDPKATATYGEGFCRTLGLEGRRYNSAEAVKAYYVGMGLTEDTSESVRELEYDAVGTASLRIGTPGKLTVSFTKATGVFSGSFRIKLKYGGVSEYKTLTFRGTALQNAKRDGILKGYFLWPRTGVRSGSKTYTYKESHPIELGPVE